MTDKGKKNWMGSIVLVIVVLMAAAGIYLYAGWTGYQQAPKFVEANASLGQVQEPYQLSDQQEEILFSHGYPEAFTILFYEEETSSGEIQPVRLESWDYYTQSMSYTFLNGTKVSEDPLDIDPPAELEALPYFPEQFGAFMTLDEVIAAAGIDSYVEVPLQKEYLENGTSYFADRLAFGMKDNELMYIEALAIIEN